MKNIHRSTITLLLFICITTCAYAQQSLEKSLLWEISGNGLEKSSYLYGTIHMICEKDFVMPDKAKQAFGKAEQLVIETNIGDPKTQEIMQKVMLSDTPLSKKLSQQNYDTVDAVLKKVCGVPLQVFENYKLVMTLVLLAQKSFSCEQPMSFEKAFLDMAQTASKPVGALEGIEEELDYFIKSYTDEEIISQIKLFDSNKAEMNRLLFFYKDQNLDSIYRFMTAPNQMDANTIHWLLEVRNNNWAVRMPEMMKNKSCFFAIGAAHLVGPMGMIRLLRDKGYTVKPVLN
ncbi:TraB/GumN family protein [Chitinophaga sp. 30R24]|uniref:TraB/GumN family protein n=1 Tax=Chitinophaga sp. 30R24 TaxID=3248838 RepID=UPI003B920FC0